MSGRARPGGEVAAYGVDAPGVVRGLLLGGLAFALLAVLAPARVRLGPVVVLTQGFWWPAGFLLGEWVLFQVYVRYGKMRHRDFMLGMWPWRGDERVLDVGCGRGLLLVGAAKRLVQGGRATGIDVWSSVDMGGNSEEATRRNLEIEGVAERCELRTVAAQAMEFPDESFDVVVSNLCLHNIYDREERRAAVGQIARVLRPGGLALLSDYKLTAEYAEQLRGTGMEVRMQWGSWATTFPPLRVVIARKPERASE